MGLFMYQISSDLICRTINDSMVIITPWNNTLHTISSTGVMIVQGLIDGKSLQAIQEEIVDQFDVSETEAEEDLNLFVDQLIHAKIFYKEGK